MGIPENCGTRLLDRAPLGLRPETGFKKELLAVWWVMQMAKATEETGDSDHHVRRVSQERMAQMLGMDRSTFNRHLQRFSEADGRWSPERREKHSRTMKDIARSQGKSVLDAAMRSVKRVATFFNKNGGFGMALLYTHRLPKELKPTREKRDCRTRDAEALASHWGEDLFDPTAHVNGFKAVDGWLYHPNLRATRRCECHFGQMKFNFQSTCSKCGGKGFHLLDDPMPAAGRVFLTGLLMMGIEKNGSLQMTQERIGERLGMDANTVAKYEDMCEDLGIIQCIPGEVFRECTLSGKRFTDKCACCGRTDGPVVDRKPHKIVWLPGRVLDADVAQLERERFNAHAARLRKLEEIQQATQAQQMHHELLTQWKGSQHSLESFQSELRRRLAAAHISQGVINALLPVYRE